MCSLAQVLIICIDDIQFGFMSGRGTADAIFRVRKLQEKYVGKKRMLYYVFVCLCVDEFWFLGDKICAGGGMEEMNLKNVVEMVLMA